MGRGNGKRKWEEDKSTNLFEEYILGVVRHNGMDC
jgi:hypothetical protein